MASEAVVIEDAIVANPGPRDAGDCPVATTQAEAGCRFLPSSVLRGSRPKRSGPRHGRRRLARTALSAALVMLLAGCYPRYDWRDHRPDCAKTWCGFVASFPGRVTNATREIPVGAVRLPLALNVVSVGEVTFAIGAFDLLPGSDAGEARAILERKLLDDVGATSGRRGRVVVRTADRSELAADSFDAEGSRGPKAYRATARFVQRQGRLVEILVIGPSDALSSGSGRQAIETFVTSLRLD